MLEAFAVMLPVAALVLAGFLFGKLLNPPQQTYRFLYQFIYYLAAPAYVIDNLSRGSWQAFFDLPYLLALLSSQFLMMFLALVITGNFFKEPFGERMLHSLSATFPNVLFLGTPIMLGVFQEQGILPVIQALLLQYIIIVPILISTLKFDQAVRRGFSHGDIRTSLKELLSAITEIVKNPIVLAGSMGLLLSVFAFQLPKPFLTMVNLLGSGFVGLALFAIGIFMAESQFVYKLSVVRESWWVVIIKTMMMPLLTWLLINIFMPSLSSVQSAAAVIISALPTAPTIHLLAIRFGIRRKRSGLEYHLTTLLAFISLSIILAYYLN